MQFLMHTDPDTRVRTLYPNKTNTPTDILKQGVVEIEMPTDKAGIMQAFQDLLTEADNALQGTSVATDVSTTHPEPISGASEDIPSLRDPTNEESNPTLIVNQWFEKAPLKVQLHWAQFALDRAADALSLPRSS